jgi:hypothetical protein
MIHSEFKDLVHDIKSAAKPLFNLTQGHLAEALAAGLGFRTTAAMAAHDQQPMPPFSETAFIGRLGELANDKLTAHATAALVAGYRASVTLTKRAERFGETVTVFDIAIVITPPAGRTMPSSVVFRLPEFHNTTGTEKYRVVADYTHRVDDKHTVTRSGKGKELLDTELQNGRWSGALSIYEQVQRVHPESCLGAVRSAMARTILSQLISMVAIDVFKPDTYEVGAWRLVMRTGPGVRAVFPDGTFPFVMPTLPKQRIFVGQYDRQHLPLLERGQFVDGMFAIDINSNGVPEDENPVPIEVVRDLFLQAVHVRLKSAGITV